MEVKQRLTSSRENTSPVETVENGKEKNSKVVFVIFYSLILDLLAFTMILPLLPALLEHYKEFDHDGGLYKWVLDKIQFLQVYIDAPERFSSVLFGGKFIQDFSSSFIHNLHLFH